MDPLEDVLTLTAATGHLSTSMAAGGRWGLRFTPLDGVKFNAIRRGACQLRVDGLADPIALTAGDCFLLTRPVPFELARDDDVPVEPADPVFRAAIDGVARAGTGDEVALIGGRFSFRGRARALLLDGLPPVIYVPGATPEADAVHWAIDRIEHEVRRAQIGSTLVAEHLAVVMLIQVLRFHLATTAAPASGWLAGLTDPVVGPALRAMHARPADRWSVETLADTAAVSRSTLAARFRALVGKGPLDYLTGWRIELAADRLRRGDGTLASIARDVGYGSESALSVAFKRVTGASPAAYRASSLT
ncbi:AraC family transcriptional regulator [Asanoa ishikariensis]|uniref:Transcriptional regulator, AraC family n=1 Tax=Asanoa ishikariensis TaxID=137265 RepID=A0A1H3UFJ1_9ACTN|nr:AraC family transcriptional regulator [Asanoa ishikariensis]GIF63758.1 AraC family transcriptional regulator [Asanoa ishikariensis]SDZ60645.1 transcriptional regulator, AraC family [Asanoa ishikariensis]